MIKFMIEENGTAFIAILTFAMLGIFGLGMWKFVELLVTLIQWIL